MSLLLLALAIACYSVSQLLIHGRFRWQIRNEGFWGDYSWWRKYKRPEVKAPNNLYYRLFNIKYREAFPLSTTFLVAFTDGYHLTQSLFFLSLSASFSLATGVNFFVVWLGIVLVHALTYRVFQR